MPWDPEPGIVLNLHFLYTGVKMRRLDQVITNVLSSSKISIRNLNSYSVKFQLAFILTWNIPKLIFESKCICFTF